MKKSLIIGLVIFMGVFLAGNAFGQTTYETISGTVQNCDGVYLVAMVLANGQYMFSNNPVGDFLLDVPLDSNGEITLQVFAAGFAPFKQVFTPAEALGVDVTLLRCLNKETCYENAYIVFGNDLTCGGTEFTATATVCGVPIDAESGEWGDCISVPAGSCNVSVYADGGNCGEFEISGTIDFPANCLTVLLFTLIDDEVDVGIAETCPGNCSSDPMDAISKDFRSNNASFKIEKVGGMESEGFTLTRITMQNP